MAFDRLTPRFGREPKFGPTCPEGVARIVIFSYGIPVNDNGSTFRLKVAALYCFVPGGDPKPKASHASIPSVPRVVVALNGGPIV